jgi:amino acid transporter
MNKTTGSPINAVLFAGAGAILMGLLVFAGSQAINSVFALSVAGLYVAYSVPIMARYLGPNDFKPGPFNLGKFVSDTYFHPSTPA